jgi:hypothetical protein
MSQENVGTLLTAVDAFNRRDGEALDKLLADDAQIVPCARLWR